MQFLIYRVVTFVFSRDFFFYFFPVVYAFLTVLICYFAAECNSGFVFTKRWRNNQQLYIHRLRVCISIFLLTYFFYLHRENIRTKLSLTQINSAGVVNERRSVAGELKQTVQRLLTAEIRFYTIYW